MHTVRCSGRLNCQAGPSPTMHTPQPCMPPCHTCPLPCTPLAMHTPCHACPLPCTPPATHTPPWTEWRLWKHNLAATRLRTVTMMKEYQGMKNFTLVILYLYLTNVRVEDSYHVGSHLGCQPLARNHKNYSTSRVGLKQKPNELVEKYVNSNRFLYIIIL